MSKQKEVNKIVELIESGDLKLLDNGEILYYNEDEIDYNTLIKEFQKLF